MKISTKAASFLSSIKTQTYDKKEREMIITYQQKRVFHLSLLMLVLCAPIYIYSVPFPNEQFYYINSVLFLFIIMCTLAYYTTTRHLQAIEWPSQNHWLWHLFAKLRK